MEADFAYRIGPLSALSSKSSLRSSPLPFTALFSTASTQRGSCISRWMYVTELAQICTWPNYEHNPLPTLRDSQRLQCPQRSHLIFETIQSMTQRMERLHNMHPNANLPLNQSHSPSNHHRSKFILPHRHCHRTALRLQSNITNTFRLRRASRHTRLCLFQALTRLPSRVQAFQVKR